MGSLSLAAGAAVLFQSGLLAQSGRSVAFDGGLGLGPSHTTCSSQCSIGGTHVKVGIWSDISVGVGRIRVGIRPQLWEGWPRPNREETLAVPAAVSLKVGDFAFTPSVGPTRFRVYGGDGTGHLTAWGTHFGARLSRSFAGKKARTTLGAEGVVQTVGRLDYVPPEAFLPGINFPLDLEPRAGYRAFHLRLTLGVGRP